eukprot:Skav230874  [mRNA]  locus=scaffold1335:459387:459989:- [translate_table: standard]
MRRTRVEAMPIPVEQKPALGDHAITLKGAAIVSALLHGGKICENRRFSMGQSWVCIHLGKSDAPNWMVQQIQTLLPNLTYVDDKPGYIYGMVFFDRSESLGAYRAQVSCTSECAFPDGEEPRHLPNCQCSPFALGPVLNFVKRRIVFHQPIWAGNGKLGRWPLSKEVVDLVLQALAAKAFTLHDVHGNCEPISLPSLPED